MLTQANTLKKPNSTNMQFIPGEMSLCKQKPAAPGPLVEGIRQCMKSIALRSCVQWFDKLVGINSYALHVTCIWDKFEVYRYIDKIVGLMNNFLVHCFWWYLMMLAQFSIAWDKYLVRYANLRSTRECQVPAVPYLQVKHVQGVVQIFLEITSIWLRIALNLKRWAIL